MRKEKKKMYERENRSKKGRCVNKVIWTIPPPPFKEAPPWTIDKGKIRERREERKGKKNNKGNRTSRDNERGRIKESKSWLP